MSSVKLITCNTSFEANVIKGRLESEGIKCYLKNETFNFIYGALISDLTGVDVMIIEEDLENAQAIINDINND